MSFDGVLVTLWDARPTSSNGTGEAASFGCFDAILGFGGAITSGRTRGVCWAIWKPPVSVLWGLEIGSCEEGSCNGNMELPLNVWPDDPWTEGLRDRGCTDMALALGSPNNSSAFSMLLPPDTWPSKQFVDT